MRNARRHSAFLLSSILILACGGSQSGPAPASPAPVSTVPASTEAPKPGVATPVPNATSSKAPAGCTDAPAGTASDTYADATALDEAVKRRDRDKHDTYVERLRLYQSAANAGHLEGQYKAGSMSFGTMFTMDAPKPSDREEYVQALTYLIVAGLRGHARARTYVPDMAAILDTKAIPATLQAPLDGLSRPWLEQALAAALKDPCVVAAAAE